MNEQGVPQDSIVVEQFVETAMETVSENTGRLFTAEEVEKIRKQEKDKLYKKLEDTESRFKSLSEQVSVLDREREEARKVAEGLAHKEREVQKEREEAEMSAKELLLRKEQEFNQRLSQTEQEWQSKLEQIEAARSAQEALLEKERSHQRLVSYRQQRMAEESDSIMPEIIDMVTGNSEEEIEASISELRERSSAILASVQQATQNAPGRLRGAQVTAPPVGPLDNQMEQQTLTAEDIRNMPMDKYIQMRDRLLNASRSPRPGRF
jgi:DNA repair exonuclease SbcCD ATPase subunit